MFQIARGKVTLAATCLALFASLGSIATGQAATPGEAARATPSPTKIKMTTLGGNGGWKVTWAKVAGANSYLVNNLTTGQEVKVTQPTAVIRDLTDATRRHNIRHTIQITAYSTQGGPSEVATSLTPCARAYLYAARGSGQAMGAGSQGLAWAKKVRSNLGKPSVSQLPLLYNPYEAVSVSEASTAWQDGDADKYFDSVQQGVDLGIGFFKNFQQSCPGSKLIPWGYSQGAHVIGNVLQSDEVHAVVNKQVRKAFLLADPRRNKSEREAVQRPKALSNHGSLGGRDRFDDGIWQKTQSWCDERDTVCNKGSFKGHAGTDPNGYLVDCISWHTEVALKNVVIYDRRARKLPAYCTS